MFTSIFTEPSVHLIKGPKGEPIPVDNLNRCGMLVYGFTAISFLVVVISYMTVSAFQTEIVSIVQMPTAGQNCTILSSFNGKLPDPKPALKGTDYEMLKSCLLDSTITASQFKYSLSCPTEFSGGDLIANTYAGFDCKPDSVSAAGRQLFDKLSGIFQSFKCAGLLEENSYINKFPLLIEPNGNSLYFPSKEKCMSDLKLNSVDINRFTASNVPIKKVTPSGGTCQLTFQGAIFDFKFSVNGYNNAGIGPSKSCVPGSTKCILMTNTVIDAKTCSAGTSTCYKYGIPDTPACPDFDGNKMVEFYNLLYPTWLEDTCSAFGSLPPYQCIDTKTPSFVTALANSFAIMNTLFAVLCALSIYLFQHGIDVTKKVWGNSSTTTVTKVSTKDLEMDEKLHTVVPLRTQ